MSESLILAATKYAPLLNINNVETRLDFVMLGIIAILC